jgi:putative pyoverdin transport system ATP-binding/permease protein
MNLFKFLIRTTPQLAAWIALAALLSGACNAGLMAVVGHAVSHPGTSGGIWIAAFVVLGLGKIATNLGAQLLLTRFSQGGIAMLRRNLVRQILTTPLRHLENVGTPRLMVALTEDVLNITTGLLSIPVVAVNLAVLFGGAVYMGWLSWQVLLLMSLLVISGAYAYRLIILSGFKQLEFGRREADRLYEHFRALTEGIKELKLHRNRRGTFLQDHIESTTGKFQAYNVAAETRFITAQGWSHLLFFMLIGIILFLMPILNNLGREALTGYVITILYLMGPLSGVLSSLSVFGRANVSLRKIDELGISLSRQSMELCPWSSHDQKVETAPFHHIELVGVTHTYRREREDTQFTLGPIDLMLNQGEIVFFVGGNGSGKSTLAKVITGLYPPEAGEIRLDGRPVTDQTRDDYRQLFSAIFSDFYLFESLLGLNDPDLDRSAAKYLELLHLGDKVSVNGGKLSSTEVSQGQRKRLALLTAYLEDRPFYLFDEWAADQDPQFKDIFYKKLLPELKSRGKGVLVISHDDRYFHIADRLLKLDYGRLVQADDCLGASATPTLQYTASFTETMRVYDDECN